MIHKPVLVKEVLDYLDLKPGENVIDCTFGEGGHAQEIEKRIAPEGLPAGRQGKVLGIDVDLGQPSPVHGSYADIDVIAQQHGFGSVHGILADLGYSSYHIAAAGRGFSFLKDEPLDMRYSTSSPLTAADIVNNWSEEELVKIFEEYGEEKFSKKIAKEIIEQRRSKKIETTFALRNIIESVVPRREKIHPATRTFQALRIAVNQELESLKTFLPKAVALLAPGGRLAVISFHSLEDRIVKHFFQQKAQEGIVEILTKKPAEASEKEIRENPRARSAKLRVIEKL